MNKKISELEIDWENMWAIVESDSCREMNAHQRKMVQDFIDPIIKVDWSDFWDYFKFWYNNFGVEYPNWNQQKDCVQHSVFVYNY